LSRHTKHNQKFEVYFCTITCYEWLPLFEESQTYEIVYQWFDHLIKDRCQITGFRRPQSHS